MLPPRSHVSVWISMLSFYSHQWFHFIKSRDQREWSKFTQGGREEKTYKGRNRGRIEVLNHQGRADSGKASLVRGHGPEGAFVGAEDLTQPSCWQYPGRYDLERRAYSGFSGPGFSRTEGAWTEQLLKQTWVKIQVWYTEKHIDRYIDEKA